MGMNARRKIFCEQYIIDRDQQRAVQRAGYSVKNASTFGNALLKDPEVQAYIAKLDDEIRKRNNITKDSLIKDICEIRDRCMQRVPVMKFDRMEKEFVQVTNEDGEGVWTFDAKNALAACDMLAKHVGFYEADKGPAANNHINVLAIPSVDDILKIKRMLDEA